METNFKKRLLSLLSVITLIIPLIPVIPTYAWTPSYSNLDPGAFNAGLTTNWPIWKTGANEIDRITFVDSATGETTFPPFYVTSQNLSSKYSQSQLNDMLWFGDGTNGKSKLDYIEDTYTNIGQSNNTGGTASVGTMMAKLNKLLTDWTTIRAGYIDIINTNAARFTSTRAGYIDKLNNFGATGDTGGSTTEGTMMAKLNAILQKVITEGVGVKSVQRGTFQELSTSQDSENAITVKLTTINPAKTFIILNGGLSAGYSGSSSAVRGYIGSVGTTNFVYKTGRAAMTISAGFISWQAVEFY